MISSCVSQVTVQTGQTCPLGMVLAENERTNIRQRQAEGIAAAKAKGVKFGRPPKPLPHNFHEVHRAWRAKKMMLKQAAEACNMPVGTFYDKARKFENIA